MTLGMLFTRTSLSPSSRACISQGQSCQGDLALQRSIPTCGLDGLKDIGTQSRSMTHSTLPYQASVCQDGLH